MSSRPSELLRVRAGTYSVRSMKDNSADVSTLRNGSRLSAMLRIATAGMTPRDPPTLILRNDALGGCGESELCSNKPALSQEPKLPAVAADRTAHRSFRDRCA